MSKLTKSGAPTNNIHLTKKELHCYLEIVFSEDTSPQWFYAGKLKKNIFFGVSKWQFDPGNTLKYSHAPPLPPTPVLNKTNLVMGDIQRLLAF